MPRKKKAKKKPTIRKKAEDFLGQTWKEVKQGVGKLLDQPDELSKLLTMAFCAYMGNEWGRLYTYEHKFIVEKPGWWEYEEGFPVLWHPPVKEEHIERPYEIRDRFVGAGTGILGYSLATSGAGGTPPVTQIAGIGLLGTIGLTSMVDIEEWIKDYGDYFSWASPLIALLQGDPGKAWSPLYALLKNFGLL